MRKREELYERGIRAQNNYEKLLKEIKKKTNFADRDIIGELRKKNSELELEVCELRKLKDAHAQDESSSGIQILHISLMNYAIFPMLFYKFFPRIGAYVKEWYAYFAFKNH